MIHENSKQALYEERSKLNARESEIYEFLLGRNENSYTDRDIKTALGHEDMNAIRPRVTELLKKGLIFEAIPTRCKVTNKTVRRVKVANDTSQTQTEMF
jgi:hypothetical protein